MAEYDIQGDCPMRMILAQRNDFLLLAMGFGGLHRVDLDLSASPPSLKQHEGRVQIY